MQVAVTPMNQKVLMPVFTTNQKKAHDLQRHLSVTANAGSGKTTVLVERFLKILLETDTKVNEVVAITFTEKAAGELRTRIAELIKLKRRDASSPRSRRRLDMIRSQLASANIGTIHAFCGRLLREYPVESNVDASFAVIDPLDRASLLESSIIETIRDAMKPDHPLRQNLLAIAGLVGKGRIESLILELVRKRELSERIFSNTGVYALADDEIILRWNSEVETEMHTLLADVPRIVRLILEEVPDEKKRGALSLLSAFESQDALEERVRLFQEILSVLKAKGRGKRGSDENGVRIQLSDIWDDIDDLAIFFQKEESLHRHRALLGAARLIASLYREAMRRFQSKKDQRGELDFEDLQLKARDLLSRPDVRTQLVSRFKYIMVDEYQDTNRLQFEIIRPLVDDFKKGNVFIVGDPKQSIYGFRNAEVEVFYATTKELIAGNTHTPPFAWNGETLASSEDEQKGVLKLAESFRPTLNIAAFVNTVFSKIMSSSRDGSVYDALACYRSLPGRPVEILLADGRRPPDERDWNEEDLIALKIQELMGSGEMFDGSQGISSSLSHRDIAILLRSRTYLTRLEEALIRQKIPYAITGGIGFYQTQEVYDFFNYFSFLANQRDDVALVGILRSPFFHFSDAELFMISQTKGADSFWERVMLFAGKYPEEKIVLDACRVLGKHIALANKIPITRLIDLILDDTAWLGSVAGFIRGEQNIANVRKLSHFAQVYESRGNSTLFDFVDRLDSLIREEERESQATIAAREDAVQVMTIHAAKGLEFPVVIVPYLAKRFNYNSGILFHENSGFSFTFNDPVSGEKQPSAIHSFMRLRERRASEAEEKRIFYVAATRARDHLVLSGTYSEKGEITYLSWLFDALGFQGLPDAGDYRFPTRTEVFREEVDGYRSELIDHEMVVRIRAAIDQPVSGDGSKGRETTPPVRAMLEEVTSSSKGEFFSATQVQTYSLCETKYFLRYILGFPDTVWDAAEDEPSPEGDDEEIEVSRNVRGVILHALLEKVDSIPDSPEALRDAIQKVLITQAINLREGDVEKLTNENYRVVRTLLNSEFGAVAFSKNLIHYQEYTVAAKFGDDFVRGTIDRLFLDGTYWTIVDYKTNSLEGNSLDRLTDFYEIQIRFYAYLIGQLFPGEEAIKAVLWFTERPGDPRVKIYPRNELTAFADFLEKSISAMRRMDSIDISTLRTKAPHCYECGYFKEDRCLATMLQRSASGMRPIRLRAPE